MQHSGRSLSFLHVWELLHHVINETVCCVTLVWSFSPVLLQTALGTAAFSSLGRSHTTHQSEGRRTRYTRKPLNVVGFVFRYWDKIFLVISDLVSHYGEVIDSQFTDIYPDLPQSLSSVSVQQDPEELALLVQRFYPLADLLNWLITGKHIQLDCTGSGIQSDKEIHFSTL